MERKIRKYTGDQVQVLYDAKRCIHAAECVRRMPAVFDPQKRPWIDLSKAAAEEVIETVLKCPTGALHYERTDGGTVEEPNPSHCIQLGENGPLYLRGRIEVVRADGQLVIEETRIALCRCGASEDKPFCDGKHTEVDFRAVTASESLPDEKSPKHSDNLVITVTPDGPLLAEGSFSFVDEHGTALAKQAKAALCRCGVSANKPLCDGAHFSIDFKAK